MDSDQRIFLVSQREIAVSLPGEKDLYEVGTISVIRQILRIGDAAVRVIAEGISRAKLLRLWQTEPYLQGNIEILQDRSVRISEFQLEALLRQTYANFGEYMEQATHMNDDVAARVMDETDPGKLADFIVCRKDFTGRRVFMSGKEI